MRTFSGAAPDACVALGTVPATWTCDCFGGIQTVDDRVSEVCDLRFIDPETGRFYVEGAQLDDTTAAHFVSIQQREA